jgi:hypothetical protein
MRLNHVARLLILAARRPSAPACDSYLFQCRPSAIVYRYERLERGFDGSELLVGHDGEQRDDRQPRGFELSAYVIRSLFSHGRRGTSARAVVGVCTTSSTNAPVPEHRPAARAGSLMATRSTDRDSPGYEHGRRYRPNRRISGPGVLTPSFLTPSAYVCQDAHGWNVGSSTEPWPLVGWSRLR